MKSKGLQAIEDGLMRRDVLKATTALTPALSPGERGPSSQALARVRRKQLVTNITRAIKEAHALAASADCLVDRQNHSVSVHPCYYALNRAISDLELALQTLL